MVELIPCARCIIERATRPLTSADFGLAGSPLLLHEASTPVCSACGQSMLFIAQLPLKQPIRLSTRGDMAYVFCCPGEYDERRWLKCETWVPGGGANAVLLQSGIPAAVARLPSSGPSFGAVLERRDEPTLEAAERQTEAGAWIDDIIWHHVKLGGTPVWVQDVEEPACPACGGSMRYVSQIPASVELGQPFREEERYAMINRVLTTGERATGRHVESVDLGYCGVGFVFICERECSPEGAAFLWQPD